MFTLYIIANYMQVSKSIDRCLWVRCLGSAGICVNVNFIDIPMLKQLRLADLHKKML